MKREMATLQQRLSSRGNKKVSTMYIYKKGYMKTPASISFCDAGKGRNNLLRAKLDPSKVSAFSTDIPHLFLFNMW